MKTLHKIESKEQFPKFWDEEWLKAAIEEVDRSAMPAEKRFAYEKLIAQNAAAVYSEKKKIEEAEQRVKKLAIERSLQKGLSPELVAEINDVSFEIVLSIQRKLTE